ncbi:MAG TPA: serine hydrolase [Caulobacteraceae bacterium]|jgi:CubicO group peptidase (beta-lactamase class C family)
MTREPAAWRIPSDAAIRDLLVERIGGERNGIAIVVGVVDGDGRRVVAHGALAEGDPRPLDGDTVFEIGSITKVFTGLVLADMVGRGEVRLDDPVARYLPAGATMPERGGRQITLVDLATHTAGLPRWPDDIAPGDLSPKDWSNPYADYTVEQLHAFLAAHRLRRDIGAGHAYSNLGVGLLGRALARRAGVDFEALVRQRITGPLGMPDTAIELSPDQQARFAVGHDQARRPVAAWAMPTFAGAGALRSTTDDLLTFLAAELGFIETPLRAAMAAQTGPRRPSDAGYIQALGWRIDPDAAGEIVWHGGATGGFRCFVLFERERRAGVVMLTNSASERNDDIPFHLLSGRPLKPAPSERVAISLSAEALESLVGSYRFSATRLIFVTREDDRLFAQLTGQWRFEVYPESRFDVFWRIADAQMSFETGADGRVTGLVLHQNGRDLPAKRI